MIAEVAYVSKGGLPAVKYCMNKFPQGLFLFPDKLFIH